MISDAKADTVQEKPLFRHQSGIAAALSLRQTYSSGRKALTRSIHCTMNHETAEKLNLALFAIRE
jgi:hypothetical protein